MVKETLRTSLTQEAIALKTSGLPHATQNTSAFLTEQGINLDLIKREYYPLAAVITDRIIERAIREKSKFPPYGMISTQGAIITSISPGSEPARITEGMIQTMAVHTLAELVDLEAVAKNENSDSPIKSVYRRFQVLTNLIEKEVDPDFAPLTFFMDGFGNALMVYRDVLTVIPQLEKQTSDHEKLLRVARNSFPFISRLSSLELDQFVTTLLGWRGNLHPTSHFDAYFDPSFFYLEEGRNGLALTVKNEDDLKPRTKSYGCPAKIVFDNEGSAVKKLWNWYLEIVAQVKDQGGDRIDSHA